MSTLKVDTITDSSSGLTTTINGFTPQTSNMAGRNLIINGDFQVNQRDNLPYTGASYCIDRWKNQSRSDGVLQTSRGQWADVGDDFFEYYMINNVTATPTDGSQVQINQFIENGGMFVNGKNFTISFYAKRVSGSTTMTVITEAQNNSNSSDSVSLTSDWQRFTITLNTVNETDFNTYAPLRLAFQYIGVGIVHVAGVQIEIGSDATPFEHRSYGEEFAACERYYHKWVAQALYGNIAIGYSASSANGRAVYYLPTTMRTTPSLSSGGSFRLINDGGTYGGSVSSISIQRNHTKTPFIQFVTSVSNLPSGDYQPVEMGADNDADAYIEFDAEL